MEILLIHLACSLLAVGMQNTHTRHTPTESLRISRAHSFGSCWAAESPRLHFCSRRGAAMGTGAGSGGTAAMRSFLSPVPLQSHRDQSFLK